MKFLLFFTALSIVNVVFSTVRTILTVKGGKGLASVLSGGYFAFYNVMLIYTVAEFPLWEKCLITFICNVIGVFIVKLFEEKNQKTKLWKIEFTAKQNINDIRALLHNSKLSYSELSIVDSNNKVFFVYCKTKDQTTAIKEILKSYKLKYVITENRTELV